jgi:hypothetical protein
MGRAIRAGGCIVYGQKTKQHLKFVFKVSEKYETKFKVHNDKYYKHENLNTYYFVFPANNI